MDKMSDASRSMLTVSFRILQRSCLLSCQLVNLKLFFYEYCWLLLVRTAAASATCWQCFKVCLSSLSSFACAENFSRRVLNSSWNPSDISVDWCSNSFVLMYILLSNSVFVYLFFWPLYFYISNAFVYYCIRSSVVSKSGTPVRGPFFCSLLFLCGTFFRVLNRRRYWFEVQLYEPYVRGFFVAFFIGSRVSLWLGWCHDEWVLTVQWKEMEKNNTNSNFTLINMMKCTLSDFPYPGILSEISNCQKGCKKDKIRQKQQSLGKTTTIGSLRYRKKNH